MQSEEQLAKLANRDVLKQLVQPGSLAAIAVVGYVIFLSFNTRPDLATFILTALGLVAIYGRKELQPRIERSDYIVILLVIVVSGISTLLSVDPTRGLKFLVYLCLNMFLLLLASAIVSRLAVQVVAGCLGLFGVLHLIALLVGSQVSIPETPSSLVRYLQMATLVVPNDALILGLCLPSFIFFTLTINARKPGFAYSAVALYILFSIYLSHLLQSKLTLISLFTALFVLAVNSVAFGPDKKLEAHRVTVMLGTFGLLLLLSASAWYVGNQSTTRLSLWLMASTAHTSVPDVLFGSGPNTFLYNPFIVDSAFDKGNLIIPWVHNLYLEAYHDQGLFGLIGILALTIIPLARALKIEDHSVRAMLVASIITFCLLALFEITLTRRFYFAFLAIMYGLSKAQLRETAP
jgi:hypothetical protein